MSVVLGISSGPHDSGACLFKDGMLLRAANEERFTRKKMEGRFPNNSIEYCLKAESLTVNDIDIVAHGWRFGSHGADLKRLMARVAEAANEGERQAMLSIMSTFDEVDQNVEARLRRGLASLGVPAARLRLYDHHLCHAAAALYLSPFVLARDGGESKVGEGTRSAFRGKEDVVCFTLDGRGDYMAGKVVRMADGAAQNASVRTLTHMEELHTLDSTTMFDSIGLLWAFVTAVLGFKPFRHEGKLTGLAASGNAEKTLPLFEQTMGLVHYGDQWCIRTFWHEERSENFQFYLSDLEREPRSRAPIESFRLCAALREHAREDVAAGLQAFTEQLFLGYIDKNGYSRSHVCLAGGVFANVQLNMQLRQARADTRIFVYPNMGDGGLCVGAAALAVRDFAAAILAPRGLVFLGPDICEDDARVSLGRLTEHSAVIYVQDFNEYARQVASYVHSGSIVGLCWGAMEFGPRALGHRSLLARATESGINAVLNARLRRTEFMPFAPVTLRAHAHEAYIGWDPTDTDAGRYMTMCYETTAAFREMCPAVVHVDGTARPQVIDERDGLYFDVLREYTELSGIHTLVNTSFNAHEEPIVCTAGDAVASFRAGSCDVLALYPFLVASEALKAER